MEKQKPIMEKEVLQGNFQRTESVMNSKRSPAVLGFAAALSLFSTSPKADQLPNPGFDLNAFHQRDQAGGFQHTILERPACAKGGGVRGVFVMETPEQDNLPLSVTTIFGASGVESHVSTKQPDALGRCRH